MANENATKDDDAKNGAIDEIEADAEEQAVEATELMAVVEQSDVMVGIADQEAVE